VQAERNSVRVVLGDHMLARDGEAHRHQRDPYNPPLRLGPVQRNYTSLIEDLAAHLLTAIEASDTAELRSAYASPLAISVAGGVLGLAFEDIERVSQIYDVFATKMVTYDDPQLERTTAPARAEFDAIVRENIRRIRREPDSSIISTVANSERPELRRSDDEIVPNVRIILFGAIETVTSSILSTTWALLTHPDQLAQAIAEPQLFAGAVNETLRWISPVGFSERWAAKDTELAGVPILRGEMLFPSIASANRDPDVFPDPDRFDIHRTNALHHDAFSRGAHHCIGTNVANLEARLAVQRLFERIPTLRLDPERPCAPSGFGFRSPRRLDLVCT
jgi:cytochrome P450